MNESEKEKERESERKDRQLQRKKERERERESERDILLFHNDRICKCHDNIFSETCMKHLVYQPNKVPGFILLPDPTSRIGIEKKGRGESG